jgi:hypothetical protein
MYSESFLAIFVFLALLGQFWASAKKSGPFYGFCKEKNQCL